MPVFSETALVWWQPVATVTTAVIIVYFVLCPMSLGTRFVGLGVFVFLGNLSYTVYLVHFGVYLALLPGPNGTHWGFWPTELLRLAVIMAIALASWFVIEKPLTRWRACAVASRVEVRPTPVAVPAAVTGPADRLGSGSAPESAGPDAPGHLAGELGADHGQVGGVGHADQLGVGGDDPHR